MAPDWVTKTVIYTLCLGADPGIFQGVSFKLSNLQAKKNPLRGVGVKGPHPDPLDPRPPPDPGGLGGTCPLDPEKWVL